MASSPEEIRKHTRTYLMVGGLLILFTFITVAVAYIPFSTAGHFVVGLSIATFKAALVAYVFMHLNDERRLVYIFLIVSAVFFIALMFLTLWGKWNPIQTIIG